MLHARKLWRPGDQHQLSRRRLLQGAMVGGAGLAAAACSNNRPAAKATKPAGATAKQPKRGGTLVHLSGAPVFESGLDPHVTGNSYTGIMGLFYQNLVRHNPSTIELEPEIAQRWEQPSQTEYVFHLAPGVKWQNKPPLNGRPLTADDVVFDIQRLGTSDARFVNKALVAGIDRAEALDRGTVKLTTKVPDVTSLINLADWSALLLAPEAVEKAGKFSTAESAVGSGAFVLQSFDQTTATLVRNPDYWKPGLPYLDGVRLINIGDPEAQWAAYLTGQIDVVTVPGKEVTNFLAGPGKKHSVCWFKDLAIQNLWQNTRVKPFDDPRVNRALRLLMDHTEMITAWVEVWFGPGSGAYISHFPEALRAWDFTPEEYPKGFLEWRQPKDDAAREALALLNAAGFNKDNPLRFTQTANSNGGWPQALAELAQAQWRRLSQGVVMSDLKVIDNAILNGVLAQGQFQVVGPAARGSYFDPGQILQDTYHSKGGRNFGKYTDPALDQMIEKQRGVFDAQQRKGLVTEILQHLIDSAPYTAPCSRNLLSAGQPRVKDLAPEMYTGVFGFQYEHIWLDA